MSDAIDLRLGDALDPIIGLPSLADRSIDVVLSDPPFDARAHRAAVEVGARCAGNRSMAGVKAGALPFAPLDVDGVNAVAAHFARLARRWIVVFCAERQIETWANALERNGARFVRVGLAERANPRPQLSGDRPAPPCDFLVIAHASGAKLRWNGRGKAGTWRSPAARFDTGRKQLHPCQKPLALMRALLSDFTDAGELVLDPYAGSGTCAIACEEMGRRFLGYEVNAGYHAIAAMRLEQARYAAIADRPIRGRSSNNCGRPLSIQPSAAID